MKVMLIGDSHLKINRLDDSLKFLSWLNQLIVDQKPNLVVNLGDSLDTFSVIRSEVFNELMKHIYFVADKGIPYVYVVGNHDCSSPKSSKYHALLPFKERIKNLYVIDEVINLFGITFVPYMFDGSKFPRKTLPICVAHQTFLGCDYGPINAGEGVNAEEVSADIIISGHIHKRHNIGKVVYVGSPYSQDKSDVDQVKGISIFDTDTYKFQFHRSSLPMWRSFSYELNQVSSVNLLHTALQEAIEGSTDRWAVELKGPKAEVVAYINSPEYHNLAENISIKLKTSFTDKEKKKISIAASSMEQIVAEYVEKVYSGNLDKNELLTSAKAVLSEVRTIPA